MPDHYSPKKSYLFYYTIGILILLYILLFTNANDPLFLSGWLCVLLFVAILKNKHTFRQPTIIDVIIGVYILFLLFSALTGMNPSASLVSLRTTFIAGSIYIITRIYFHNYHICALLAILTVIVFFLGLLSLLSFYSFEHYVTPGDFDNLYELRYLQMPLGFSNNMWASILLSLTGIPLLSAIMNRHRRKTNLFAHLTFAILIGCLILSFSRGIYLSLIPLIISYFSWQIAAYKKNKAHLINIAVVLLSILFPILWHPQEIRMTLSMAETCSQQRSTKGRINMCQATISIFDSIPAYGSGNGSFSMVTNDYLFENDNIPYTNLTGSTLIQSIIEKGWLGTLLLCFLLVNLLRTIIYNLIHKKYIYGIFLIIFSTCFIREMTFPSLFEQQSVLVIFFFYVAMLNNLNRKYPREYTIKHNMPIWLTPIVACLLLSIPIWKNMSEIKTNNLLIKYLKSKNYTKITELIPQKPSKSSDIILKSILLWKEYLSTGQQKNLLSLKILLSDFSIKNPYDKVMKFNLALVLFEAGEQDSALQILQELSSNYPQVALYQFGLHYCYTQLDQREKAAQALINCIRINPLFLESQYWRHWKKKEIEFYHRMKTKYLNQTEHNTFSDPIQLSKQGIIYMEFGDSLQAKNYFKRALEKLPTMSRTWYYLSLTDTLNQNLYRKRAEILDPHDFIYQRNPINKIDRDFQNHIFNSFIRNYILKYRHWYGREPAVNDILFIKDLLN